MRVCERDALDEGEERKRERVECTSTSLWSKSGILSQESLHTNGASLHFSQQPGSQRKGYHLKKNVWFRFKLKFNFRFRFKFRFRSGSFLGFDLV